MREGKPRHRRLVVHAAPLLPLLLGLCGCGLEDPQAPSFHTEIHIPVGTLSYTVAELIESETAVDGDTTGSYPVYLTYEGTIDSVEVGDRLVADIQSVALSATVRDFIFEIETPPPVVFHFGDIAPVEIPPGGGTILVPPFSVTPVDVDLDPVPDYRWAYVAAGSLELRFRNDLPIAVENLVVQVRDILLEETITTIGMPGRLDPGEESIQRIDMSGKTISNQLRVRLLSGSSPGSGEPVAVEETDAIILEIRFTAFRFHELFAKIAAQSYARSDSAAIEGSIRILRASVSSWVVPLQLQSTIPLPVTMELTLPQVMENEVPWSRRYALPAGREGLPATLSLEENLAGTDIVFSDTDAPQWFRYRLRVDHRGSQGETIELNGEMGASALIGPSRLTLDELIGIVEPQELRIDPVETTFEIPDETEGLEFLEAVLSLKILNEAQVSGRLVSTLTGSRDGTSATVPLEGLIAAATPAGPATTELEWNQDNSRILELLNLRPETIVFEGSVSAGDTANVVLLRRQDRILGRYELRSPAKIRIRDTSYRPDPFDLEIDTDIQDRIRDEVDDAHASLTIRNHLPIGAALIVQFAADSASVYSMPHVVLDSIRVASGVLDPMNGRVIESRVSDVEIALTSEEIDFFARDRVYGGVLIVPDATGEEFIEVLTTDRIEMEGIVSFQVRVD